MQHPHDESQEPRESHEAILIPWQRLSEDALVGVIEEFITREGTDYGHSEATLDDKRAAIMRQLRERRAVIEFDPESETCTLRPVR